MRKLAGAVSAYGVPMAKVAVMIDGGYARNRSKAAKHNYTPAFIEKLAHSCCIGADTIQRILYYDCAPYAGRVRLPVSGKMHTYPSSDAWLHELSHKDLIAVRRGVLKFRGFVPQTVPLPTPHTDADFRPEFEQKGVDMRIGLDMANYASNRAVDLIALMTNDTDCIPAMKYARRAGLQVALVVLPNGSPAPELLGHCDFVRKVPWP